MNRFVRIDKEGSQKTVLLNLDLVATVELAQASDLLSSNNDSRKVYATFMAPDKTAIATLHFDSAEDANTWVAAHLGVQL
ncbi:MULTISPECIES: hypothetical protein [unclassified Massilia]|jgi:hypothetical protein|uniref:hypothetical protein n=1 Tax=unclassified Massilia TaxID=2609279 RepID=UPI001B83C62B|nr:MULTISPECIES: hypothetical protein [unclassified Massilia]MBQ5939888.1 hypothetical protein [Massilia sp. AB1]MBQ5965214.1 hypothetical protein [Massilia sp. ZL223]